MRSEGEGSFNYRGTQRSDRALCGGFHTDTAIEAALTIRMVFHLPLRQTEGFLRPIHNPVTVRLVTESGVNESNGLGQAAVRLWQTMLRHYDLPQLLAP